MLNALKQWLCGPKSRAIQSNELVRARQNMAARLANPSPQIIAAERFELRNGILGIASQNPVDAGCVIGDALVELVDSGQLAQTSALTVLHTARQAVLDAADDRAQIARGAGV